METNSNCALPQQSDDGTPSGMEQRTDAAQPRELDDLSLPPSVFVEGFGSPFGLDVEQLKRDADAASLTGGTN